MDLVRQRVRDGDQLSAAERLLNLGVGNRLFIAGVDVALRKLDEGIESRVVSVYVELCHGVPLFSLFGFEA